MAPHSREHEDPNLICTLLASGERAAALWMHPHNSSRYKPSSFNGVAESGSDTEYESGSKSPAPGSDAESESGSKSPASDERDTIDLSPVGDIPAQIRLTFDNLPKDLNEGFVFGSSRRVCDIFCGKPEEGYSIQERTFTISFDKAGRLVLRHIDERTHTYLVYNDQDPAPRREFTWILFSDANKIHVIVSRKLEFDIMLPKYGKNKAEHQRLLSDFLKKRKNPVLTRPLTLDQRPFYYHCPDGELGQGAFGKVFLVKNASEGQRYAAKSFVKDFSFSEAHMLESLNHEHIIKYVGTSFEDEPKLVMEYCRFGSLESQKEDPFSVKETATILFQGLQALEYLHTLEKRVVHRDIKPDNILIKRRHPSMVIKLADFGLAKASTCIQGACGTLAYMAPECFTTNPYDAAVDIWSLGVVVFQCLNNGLPRSKGGVRSGYPWAKDIVAAVSQRKSFSEMHELVFNDPEDGERARICHFLLEYMLLIDGSKRSSATVCLQNGMSTIFADCSGGAEAKEAIANNSEPEHSDDEKVPDTDEEIWGGRSNGSLAGNSEKTTVRQEGLSKQTAGSESPALLSTSRTEKDKCKSTNGESDVHERESKEGPPKDEGSKEGELTEEEYLRYLFGTTQESQGAQEKREKPGSFSTQRSPSETGQDKLPPPVSPSSEEPRKGIES